MNNSIAYRKCLVILNEELEKCLDAEEQLLRTMPIWALDPVDPRLKTLIHEYIGIIKQQIATLVQYADVRPQPGRMESKVMKALTRLRKIRSESYPAARGRDEALLSDLVAVNRYKITMYESVRDLAASLRIESINDIARSFIANERNIAERLLAIGSQLGRISVESNLLTLSNQYYVG